MQDRVRRTGTLATGNHYELTDSKVRIFDPDRKLLFEADYADLKSVRRSSQTVILEHDERGRVDLLATSTADASLIEGTITANRMGNRPVSTRSALPWIIVAGLAVLLIGAGALLPDSQEDDTPRSSGLSRSSNSSRTSTSTRRQVIYQVSTSSRSHPISLTYENQSGNSEQLDTTTRNGEWTKSLRLEPGDFMYVSVQNDQDSGTVECKILVDGRVVERAKSSGSYVIATCSGSVPRD